MLMPCMKFEIQMIPWVRSITLTDAPEYAAQVLSFIKTDRALHSLQPQYHNRQSSQY